MCDCNFCCVVKALANKVCNEKFFAVRKKQNTLELSGYIFKVICEDENIVVANKINNIFNSEESKIPYTFDKSHWEIIPVSYSIAAACK